MDFLSVKIGRQELSYDDVRLLGNLDWLQQARRHDMLLIKGLHRGYQIDIGLAYNQNSDVIGVNGTTYVPANIPSHVKKQFRFAHLVQELRVYWQPVLQISMTEKNC